MMVEFASVEDLLDFAIGEEEAAHRFYVDLAARMERPDMRETFERFAQEELGHKALLERFKRGELQLPPAGEVLDLKIADYLVDVEVRPDLSYREALIVAMKKEKSAFRLYQDLADLTGDAEVKHLLEVLAQEEAKHKLRFELEYDELEGVEE